MSEPDLASYDWILVASSAGKDSQAMLDVVVERARAAGVLERVVVGHFDLGRVEWTGTRELAEEQARHYGVRFEVLSRPQGDLLEQVEAMGFWPKPSTRYCTSDHKRAPAYRLMTRLAAEWRATSCVNCGPAVGKHHRHQRAWQLGAVDHRPARACRILNAMGFRAEESPGRANCTRCGCAELRPKRAGKRWGPMSSCAVCGGTGERQTLEHDVRASNSLRHVDVWLPIHKMTESDVWTRIRASGVRHHRAYDLGMRRLSCVFCIYAPVQALMLAGTHNPELLAEYVRVEDKIGHAFKFERKQPVRLRVIQERLTNGERAEVGGDDGCWNM